MMEETLILLRFNCPDGSCDYIAGGWGDLKLHVRGAHGNLMWYDRSSLKSGFDQTVHQQRPLHPDEENIRPRTHDIFPKLAAAPLTIH